MKTKKWVASLGLILGTILIVNPSVIAATISRITTFTDGTVLYAADLNAEFNNIINAFNGGIDNDNIASNANISPLKISTNIVGNGLTRNSGTGALSVVTDNTLIGISSNQLTIVDRSIATIKIATAAVTTNELALNSVTTQIIAPQSVTTAKLGLSSVTTQIIADRSVTPIKRPTVSAVTTTGTLGNVAVSNSSGTYTTSSSSFVDITNLNLTLPTIGRPVQLLLIGDGSAAGALGCNSNIGVDAMCGCEVRFVEGSTGLSSLNFAAPRTSVTDSPTFPASGFQHLHVTATGTKSYKVQIRMNSAIAAQTTECRVLNTRLVAFEL